MESNPQMFGRWEKGLATEATEVTEKSQKKDLREIFSRAPMRFNLD
jgi:hypothetical protein